MLTRRPNPDTIDAAALFAPLLEFFRIGVAVSGGPDSLALMVLLAGWAKANDRQLFIYTVDHGLRPEAAGEAEMVAREAQRRGLSCRILTWTGDKPATGVQSAARRARYRLIGAAMQADGAETLVTAHHLHDQAETVLMRLSHGSGISGLAAMAPFAEVEGVRLFRPLLATDPSGLRAVLTDAGLDAAADPSNHDIHYERVRWRKLLPELAREGLDASAIVRFSNRMARADSALGAATDAALATLVSADPFGMLKIDARGLFALPEEIAIRLLRKAVDWAAGGAPTGRLGQIETLHAELASAEEVATTLWGAGIARTRDAIAVFREAGRMDVAETRVQPGTAIVWDNRFDIAVPASSVPVRIAPAGGLTREQAEEFAGARIAAPMTALAAAPAIRDGDDHLLAIGTLTRPGAPVIALTFAGAGPAA